MIIAHLFYFYFKVVLAIAIHRAEFIFCIVVAHEAIHSQFLVTRRCSPVKYSIFTYPSRFYPGFTGKFILPAKIQNLVTDTLLCEARKAKTHLKTITRKSYSFYSGIFLVVQTKNSIISAEYLV